MPTMKCLAVEIVLATSSLFSVVAHAAPLSATTATSLQVSVAGTPASSVARGTVVTLTASVLAGSTAVSTGEIQFCDAAGASCAGNFLLGSAQLTSAGTANLRLRPGPGTHTYKAVFIGTSTNSRSTSLAVDFQVTGSSATSTVLSQGGTSGNYTLTATVSGAGVTAPTGKVSYLDTSNKGAPLATATLNAGGSTQTFAKQVTFPTGSSPIASETADFNGDGIQDIAVANYGENSVGVLIGKGDGTFNPQTTFATGNMPSYLAKGDFNSDGNIDLAVVNSASRTVGVLMGKGDGTFLPQVTYATGNTPAFVAAADLDGDGVLDLLVSNSLSSTVSIYHGKGDGTFNTQVTTQAGPGVLSIAVADFNADNVPDCAVTNFFNDTISVLLGTGAGSFTSPVTFPVGTGPTPIVAADFNHDGKVDLAVANYNANTISVLTGNGDGTFADQVVYATGAQPYALAPADYDGDGVLDLAVANYHANTAGVLLGKADGTFAAQVTYATGDGPSPISSADFNGDGIADLVASNYHANTLSVLLGEISSVSTGSATGISPAGATESTHLVDAVYGGDSLYSASTSSTVVLNATPVSTTLTLAAQPDSSNYGQQVALSAVLTPYAAQSVSTAGEAISFYNETQLLGTAPLSNGAATLNLTSLAVGTSSLRAVYAGDATFAGSTSIIVPHTVVQPTTALSVSSVSLPAGTGSATLTAQVTYTATMGPTGDVTFTVDSGTSVMATCVGSASPRTCSATYPIGSLTAGTHTIVASLAADGIYTRSTASASLTLVSSDFTFAGPSVPAQTVTGGGTATFNFALSPGSGPYPGDVSFAVTGLPSGTTYTVSPSSVSASAGAQSIVLTVHTSSLTSGLGVVPMLKVRSALVFAAVLLPFFSRRRLVSRSLMTVGGCVLLALSTTGCGSSSSRPATISPVTSTIVVTATASGYPTTHSASVTLTVR